MIEIQKSKTADTRTCDFANTTKETLLDSSRQHIGDIVKGIAFFSSQLTEAAGEHDYDKLTAIDWFHADFVTGFKQTGGGTTTAKSTVTISTSPMACRMT